MKMAKAIYMLFCELQTQDASGKSAYIGIFHSLNIFRTPSENVTGPLPQQINTGDTFYLVSALSAGPEQECDIRLDVLDVNQEPIMPAIEGHGKADLEGRLNVNFRFENGIPVIQSGIYDFCLSINSIKVANAQLPIMLDIKPPQTQGGNS